jgi:stage V sporulation protein SpoVS
MTSTSPDDRHRLHEIGTATTTASSDGDSLEPARAVRRALAAARAKAFEVTAMAISSGLVHSDAQAAAFARVALGPHGDDIVCVVAADAQMLERLASVLTTGEMGVAVHHRDDTTLACCLRRLPEDVAPTEPDERTG